jgi:hypothetical protein
MTIRQSKKSKTLDEHYDALIFVKDPPWSLLPTAHSDTRRTPACWRSAVATSSVFVELA